MDNLPRNFKGIWIPKEIWIHNELTFFEKCLWAEIDSLDDQEKGCTASNAYLCKIFSCKERTLQDALSKLKKIGMINYEKYDGRTRTLRSCVKTTYEKFSTSDPQPGAGANFRTSEMRDSAPLNTPLVSPPYISPPSLPPKEKKEEKKESFLCFGKFVELEKTEIDALRELCGGQETLDAVISEINDYLASTGKKPYKDYAATIRNWIRRRKTNQGRSEPPENERLNLEAFKGACRALERSGRRNVITLRGKYIYHHTGDSVSITLPSETFLEVLCSWTGLEKK